LAVSCFSGLDPDGTGQQLSVTLANDNNGNLTQNPWAFNAGDSGTPTGQKYEYDEENRLTRVRRPSNDQILLEIGYDALGRRVESKEYLDAQTGQMLTTTRVTHHVVLGPMTMEEYRITGPLRMEASGVQDSWSFSCPLGQPHPRTAPRAHTAVGSTGHEAVEWEVFPACAAFQRSGSH
jgi:YD repeat-containing protein